MFDLSTNAEMTMTSSELAELLGYEKKEVNRKIKAMFAEKIDGGEISPSLDSRGYVDYYHLPEKESKMFVARHDIDYLEMVIDYWMGKGGKSNLQIPQTYADALLLAANQAKRIEDQDKAIALAAPKAEFVDRYVESTGLMTFRQVSKLLKIKETEFRSFLVAIRAMYLLNGSWAAYQPHLEAGRFEERSGEKNGHAFVTTKFTAKGVEWIAKKWGEVKGMAA